MSPQTLFIRLILIACLAAGCARQPAAAAPAPLQKLADGVYGVLRESTTPAEASVEGVPNVVLRYDQKYSDADQKAPPRYIAIDPSSSVSIVVEGKPAVSKDGKGHSMLSVTLPRKNIKRLEDFTSAHLGGKIAIVCDGEIVTLHKVRAVIHDGKVQIARCNDDACDILLTKLSADVESRHIVP